MIGLITAAFKICTKYPALFLILGGVLALMRFLSNLRIGAWEAGLFESLGILVLFFIIYKVVKYYVDRLDL